MLLSRMPVEEFKVCSAGKKLLHCSISSAVGGASDATKRHAYSLPMCEISIPTQNLFWGFKGGVLLLIEIETDANRDFQG